jgi:hypothetical protein
MKFEHKINYQLAKQKYDEKHHVSFSDKVMNPIKEYINSWRYE